MPNPIWTGAYLTLDLASLYGTNQRIATIHVNLSGPFPILLTVSPGIIFSPATNLTAHNCPPQHLPSDYQLNPGDTLEIDLMLHMVYTLTPQYAPSRTCSDPPGFMRFPTVATVDTAPDPAGALSTNGHMEASSWTFVDPKSGSQLSLVIEIMDDVSGGTPKNAAVVTRGKKFKVKNVPYIPPGLLGTPKKMKKPLIKGPIKKVPVPKP